MRLGYNALVGDFSFKGPIDSVFDTVLALTSKVVDVISLNDFNSLEYSFTIQTTSGSRFFRMIVNNDGGSLSDQVFARSGGLVLAVDVAENLGVMEITIVNGEVENMEVSFTRIIN